MSQVHSAFLASQELMALGKLREAVAVSICACSLVENKMMIRWAGKKANANVMA